MNNESFMKEKPVIGLVLSMSLPMVFSMMVNALYNIVDSFFVAKISEDAMTALSLVFPVQNLMSAVSIGFGVGINAVIAFFLGAGEKKKADQAASLGFFWNAVQGLVLTVVCIAIIPVFLRLFSNDERTIGYALECILAAYNHSNSSAFQWEFHSPVPFPLPVSEACSPVGRLYFFHIRKVRSRTQTPQHLP